LPYHVWILATSILPAVLINHNYLPPTPKIIKGKRFVKRASKLSQTKEKLPKFAQINMIAAKMIGLIKKASTRNIAKKGKPSYFMSIMGVTIVLFLWGVFGVIWITLQSFIKNKKEKAEVSVYLNDGASKTEIDSLIALVKAEPFTNDIKFTSKEKALDNWVTKSDEKFDFSLLDSTNFLPASIDFTVKQKFAHNDSLTKIKAYYMGKAGIVNDVVIPKDVINQINNFFDKIKWWFIIIAIIFSVLVFLLLDNTIKLAMYSNRFLIKTMQMVGATRNFITLPMDKRAMLNGALSGAVAIVFIYALLALLENNIPDLKQLRNNSGLFWLFFLIIIAGVVITVVSTHRSVIKYLKMRLDDLY
jgi:cell division transport system permease protein